MLIYAVEILNIVIDVWSGDDDNDRNDDSLLAQSHNTPLLPPNNFA